VIDEDGNEIEHDPSTCEDCANGGPLAEPFIVSCCMSPDDKLGVTPANYRGMAAVLVQTLVNHRPLPNAVASFVANNGWVRSAVVLHPSVARRIAAELLNAADVAEGGTDEEALETPDDLSELNGESEL
jgi:hypothetical protein